MNPYDQKMPKPLYRDYSAEGLRAPKEKKERQPRDKSERADGGEKRPLSLAAMICGLCAIAFLFIPVAFNIVIAPVCGIAGMVLASRARKKEGKNGLNRAGLATSIIGVVLIGLLVVLFVALFAAGAAFIGRMGGLGGIEDVLGSAFSGIGSQGGFITAGSFDENYLPEGVTISEEWQEEPGGSVYYEDGWAGAAEPDGSVYYESSWEDAAPGQGYAEAGWGDVYAEPEGAYSAGAGVVRENFVPGADADGMSPEGYYEMQPAA